MTIPSPLLCGARSLVGGAIISITATLGMSGVVSAHTDFESSVPTDQATIDGPLDEVIVNFTNPATEAGSGFQLLDPDGNLRVPTSVDSTDGTTFVLGFDPPLSAGTYGVRWKVQAGDAHPIEGSFQFDVNQPPTTAVAPTTAAPTAAPTVSASTVPPTTAPPATVAPADPPASTGSGGTGGSTSLDEFLSSTSDTVDGQSVGRVGRTLTFGGTIFGVGALAALIWVIRGQRQDLHRIISWIRLAGLAIAVGGLIELVALQASQATGIATVLDSKPGIAALLKLAGGLAVWFGFHDRAGRLVPPPHALSAAVATDLPGTFRSGATTVEGHRWSPTASAGVGMTGFALVLASFWFDGHTVSKGPWVIHSLVNFVHLGAAAVWGGGVFAMTAVAWLRRRRSERVGMAAMVVRFSTLATISLAAVILAGLAMTFLILDSPGELVSTQWGQVLILKTAAVSIAAGMGGYNHFRLRPALEQAPDDPDLARELRVSLTIESVVFAAVVILTAWLVAAGT